MGKQSQIKENLCSPHFIINYTALARNITQSILIYNANLGVVYQFNSEYTTKNNQMQRIEAGYAFQDQGASVC